MPTFGVLGSGEVGQVLAKGLKRHGYEVRIGSRSRRQAGGILAGVRHPGGRLRRGGPLGRGAGTVGPGHGGRGGARPGRPRQPPRQAGYRHDQPHRRRPARAGRAAAPSPAPTRRSWKSCSARYPEARFVKAFNSVGSARMVESRLRRHAGRRCSSAATTPGRRPRSRGFWTSSAGTRPTWARAGRPGDRAAGGAVVHPGVPAGRVDACVSFVAVRGEG